ncbi:hypothetical protein ACFLZ8_02250, partial [Planctomycetota bacterium]
GGEKDIAYPNGMDDFSRIDNVPVFVASYDFSDKEPQTNFMRMGYGHYPATYLDPHGGAFAQAAAAWLKWQMKGDEESAKMFTGEPCGLAKDENWEIHKKNIP